MLYDYIDAGSSDGNYILNFIYVVIIRFLLIKKKKT